MEVIITIPIQIVDMQIGKLSAGILNMKIDTFDSRTTPSEGTIPGLNIAIGNSLGLNSSGKGKSSKKKNKNKSADKCVMAVNSLNVSNTSNENSTSSSTREIIVIALVCRWLPAVG